MELLELIDIAVLALLVYYSAHFVFMPSVASREGDYTLAERKVAAHVLSVFTVITTIGPLVMFLQFMDNPV